MIRLYHFLFDGKVLAWCHCTLLGQRHFHIYKKSCLHYSFTVKTRVQNLPEDSSSSIQPIQTWLYKRKDHPFRMPCIKRESPIFPFRFITGDDRRSISDRLDVSYNNKHSTASKREICWTFSQCDRRPAKDIICQSLCTDCFEWSSHFRSSMSI